MNRGSEKIQISVITSLYRCAEFLANFLVQYSKIDNIDECELILIHNDPTDTELEIIASSVIDGAKMLHICVARENLYSSWNRGIQCAVGQYIAVWNVDDIRTPDSLSAQYLALQKSGAALCYGDFYGTSAYGSIKDRLYNYWHYRDIRHDIFKRHIIGCFPMWRKDIHKQIGYFDEQFKLAGDFEFQLRVASRYPLVKAESILGFYLEYAGHKLSSNKLVQHSERTAIQLRYKLYDRLLLHFLPFVGKYKITYLKNFDKWIPLSDLVDGRIVPGINHAAAFIRMPFSYFFWFCKWSSQTLINRTFNRHLHKRTT